jgi:hypothetical protein
MLYSRFFLLQPPSLLLNLDLPELFGGRRYLKLRLTLSLLLGLCKLLLDASLLGELSFSSLTFLLKFEKSCLFC